MPYLKLFLALAVLASPLLRAQEPPALGLESKESRRWIQKIQENMREENERRLGQLQKSDPEEYRRQKEALGRQKESETVLERWRQGTLSEKQARRQLYPLVKEGLKPELEGLDKRIADLEKRLDFLKQVRKNPDLLVRRRIEEMLGKRPPEDIGLLW